MNKKYGFARVEFIARIDTIQKMLQEGYPYTAIYDKLVTETGMKMGYRAFCYYIKGRSGKIKRNNNIEFQRNTTNISKVNVQNNKRQKINTQHQQQNPAPAKRKIIGLEEKQEIKVVTLDDMVG